MRFPLLFAALSLALPAMELQSYPTTEQLLQEQLNDNEPPQIFIRSQLTEQEADELIDFLDKHGIPSTKKMRKSDQAHLLSQQIWEVAVAPTDTVEAVLLLDEEGLPKRKQISIFEEFVTRLRASYTMSESQQAIAEELEKSIEQKKGVVEAEILIKSDPQKNSSRVLVYIQHTGSLDDPHSELANAIKKEVLDHVPDLSDDHLILIAERATRKHPALKAKQQENKNI